VFGLVENDLVFLSPLGVIARDRLVQIPEHHSTVTVDSYVVMPNHVHALLRLDEQRELELGDVVATYKAAVSRAARHKGSGSADTTTTSSATNTTFSGFTTTSRRTQFGGRLTPRIRTERRRGEIYLAPTSHTIVAVTTGGWALHGKSIQRSVRRQTYSHFTTEGDFS